MTAFTPAGLRFGDQRVIARGSDPGRSSWVLLCGQKPFELADQAFAFQSAALNLSPRYSLVAAIITADNILAGCAATTRSGSVVRWISAFGRWILVQFAAAQRVCKSAEIQRPDGQVTPGFLFNKICAKVSGA